MVWTSDFIDSAFLAKTTFPDDVYMRKLFGVTETDEHIGALKCTPQNTPMCRIWDSPNDQPLIWISVSPWGHEYAWPAARAHLLVLFPPEGI